MQYLRARYYDPTMGRFLGRDPLMIGNRYSYVSNNPVNYVDPYGLFSIGGVDVTPDFVDDFVDDTLEAATSGPAVLDIINLLDLFPLAETCWLVGGVVGGAAGGIIGTGVAPGAGTLAGVGIGAVGGAGAAFAVCQVAEGIIGVVATTANVISIAQSDCPTLNKLGAMGLNMANGAIDLGPVISEPLEAELYILANDFCGSGSNGGSGMNSVNVGIGGSGGGGLNGDKE